MALHIKKRKVSSWPESCKAGEEIAHPAGQRVDRHSAERTLKLPDPSTYVLVQEKHTG